MALKFMNGIQVGLESSGGLGYGWGMQHIKRLIYLWLKNVVGWTQVDIKGNGFWGSAGNWDNPLSALVTNGATDATDPTKLTSATSTWVTDTVTTGDLALIIGFADPARNGFYTVQKTPGEGEIRIQPWNGVHTDGLPLGEIGLSVVIHRLHTSALMPIDDDAWILEGTGVGGTFHLRCVNDRTINYGGGWEFDISPWPDWLVGTHVWDTPSRHTSLPNKAWNSGADICWVYAVADLDFVFVWFRSYGWTFNAVETGLLYAGDIDAYHPGFDPRPVVIALGQNTLWNEPNDLNEFSRMIGADDLTEVTAIHMGARFARDDASNDMLSGNFRTRSWHTDRFMRYPIILTCEQAGFEEVRGQLKHITRGHQVGPRYVTPIGSARDQLRLGWANMPWNGSKQLRYVF